MSHFSSFKTSFLELELVQLLTNRISDGVLALLCPAFADGPVCEGGKLLVTGEWLCTRAQGEWAAAFKGAVHPKSHSVPSLLCAEENGLALGQACGASCLGVQVLISFCTAPSGLGGVDVPGGSSCLLGSGRCPEWVVLGLREWGLEGVPQAGSGVQG